MRGVLVLQIVFWVFGSPEDSNFPTFSKCWASPQHLGKVGLRHRESQRTPETSEFDCRGQNTSHWGVLYIIAKLLKCRCRKWPCMGYLQHKLWQKEGLGVKMTIWFPTTKSQESTQPWCVQVDYDTPLERFQGELQVFFRTHPNRRSEQRVMTLQSPRNPNWESFETPLWESQDKKPFGCGCCGEAQSILYGGRWWLPPSPGRGESCESRVAHGLS